MNSGRPSSAALRPPSGPRLDPARSPVGHSPDPSACPLIDEGNQVAAPPCGPVEAHQHLTPVDEGGHSRGLQPQPLRQPHQFRPRLRITAHVAKRHPQSGPPLLERGQKGLGGRAVGTPRAHEHLQLPRPGLLRCQGARLSHPDRQQGQQGDQEHRQQSLPPARGLQASPCRCHRQPPGSSPILAAAALVMASR